MGKLVKIVHECDDLFSFEELSSFVPKADAKKSPKRSFKAKGSESLPDDVAKFEPIYAGCSFIKGSVDNAKSVSEPAWYHTLTIASRCEDGRAVCHQISEVYPDYNYDETEHKIDHALSESGGPTTCAYISEGLGFEGCKSCPMKQTGKLTSPIGLGFFQPELTELISKNVYCLTTNQFFEVTSKNMSALSEKSLSVSVMCHAFAKPATQFNLCQLSLKARGTTYQAGKPRFIHEGDDIYLNLWSGSDVVPVKGNWDTIAEHFEYQIKDSEQRLHWYNYLACMLQRPHLKLKHVLLLTGSQGTGKSFFGALAKFIHGSRNVGIAETSHLRSEFNSVFVNKVLIIIEELMAAKHLETENMMKPLISETTIMCNEKCIPRFEARTPLAFMAFSNYEKCINLSEDDRRWHVVHSEATKKPPEYYDKLFAAIETEGPAFMYYLMYEHDLSDFNHNAAPPMTEAKQNLIHRSFTPVRAALTDLIETGLPPFHKDIVSSAELDLQLSICPNVSARSREPRNVSDTLKQMGMSSLGQRMVKGVRHSLWIIRNQEKWSQATSEAIREEFKR